MPSIYAYQKIINALTTVQIALPVDPTSHQQMGTELCTLSGTTYVVIPDGYTLPIQQPQGISPVAQTLPLPQALHDQICADSPHTKLIDQRVRDGIASQYSIEDEMKLHRLQLGSNTPLTDFTTYNAVVEENRTWGKTEKAKLGL